MTAVIARCSGRAAATSQTGAAISSADSASSQPAGGIDVCVVIPRGSQADLRHAFTKP